MQNPFVYGEVVPGDAFVDREAELDRLIADLAAGQKVFLISPRRYGKSSLVRQALTRPGAARRAHRRGHRQQLQLLLGVPRRLRAGAGGGRDAMGARARLADRGHQLDAARGPLRRRSEPAPAGSPSPSRS